MTTVYPPAPYGLKLKLSRARKHLRHLRRIVGRYEASNPWALRCQENADGSYYLYSLEFVDAPTNILLLADEAIHHLRSVLDHLVCASVASIGKKIESQSFPIRTEEPKGKSIAIYDACLRDVPDPVRALVDSVQPYHRGDGAKSHPLAILARLDNGFKHTSLHLMTNQVRMPAVPGIIQHPARERSHDSGDIFAEVPTSVNVEKDFEPFISVEVAFRIREARLPQINLDTLDGIYDFIRDEILRKLVRWDHPPRRMRTLSHGAPP